MTRKRGEWWAKLSPKERVLRSEIRRLKGMVKHYKLRIPLTKDNKDYHKYNIRQVNEHNVLIRALKHELDYQRPVGVELDRSGFYCTNCGFTVQKFDSYCHRCGKKLDWSVAGEQYQYHGLLEAAEGFLTEIKSCGTDKQKIYCLNKANDMINVLRGKYEKKVNENASKKA